MLFSVDLIVYNLYCKREIRVSNPVILQTLNIVALELLMFTWQSDCMCNIKTSMILLHIFQHNNQIYDKEKYFNTNSFNQTLLRIGQLYIKVIWINLNGYTMHALRARSKEASYKTFKILFIAKAQKYTLRY